MRPTNGLSDPQNVLRCIALEDPVSLLNWSDSQAGQGSFRSLPSQENSKETQRKMQLECICTKLPYEKMSVLIFVFTESSTNNTLALDL